MLCKSRYKGLENGIQVFKKAFYAINCLEFFLSLLHFVQSKRACYTVKTHGKNSEFII